MERSRSRHSFYNVTFSTKGQVRRQRYGKRHKKPSAKPGNRVPRVKVLNYLKKVALFFRFERDILAVKDRLTLTLAKLTQHLKVNTVIAEFLFHKS